MPLKLKSAKRSERMNAKKTIKSIEPMVVYNVHDMETCGMFLSQSR